VVAAEGTMQTDVQNIFAGGDGWRGAATAVQAIRDGRFAARGIHRYLSEDEEVNVPDNWLAEPPKLPGVDTGVSFAPTERARMRELTVDQRRGNFDEVELGLTEEMARKESERCLQCGLYCYRGYRTKEKAS
jgi:NADPH-dependent glutamate synthase beta subunit-like oxidoreductase